MENKLKSTLYCRRRRRIQQCVHGMCCLEHTAFASLFKLTLLYTAKWFYIFITYECVCRCVCIGRAAAAHMHLARDHINVAASRYGRVSFENKE